MNRHLLAAALFPLSLTTFCACTPAERPTAPAGASVASSRDALIQRITHLPDYCVYEESKDQFIERLHQGDYWSETEGSDTVEYLHIGGDGCWSCRLFMLVNQAELYILVDDWEGDPRPTEDFFLHYNSQTNDFVDSGRAPKSILAADAPGYTRPARAWFRLMTP